MEQTPQDIILTPEAAEIFRYIQDPDNDTKQRLIAKYEPILQAAVESSIELLNAAKKDPNFIGAISYDESESYRQLSASEITPDDYLNSQGKKESENLLRRLGKIDLSRPLTFLQILKYHQKKPGKRVTGKMADAIGAQVKQIYKQTKLPRPLLHEFAIMTATGAMIELFITYQYEPYLETRRRAYAAALEQQNVFAAYDAADPGERGKVIELYRETMEKSAKTLGEVWRDQNIIFDETGIPQRIDQLIAELYPETDPTPDQQTHTLDKPYVMVLSSPLTKAAKQILNAPGRVRNGKGKGTSYSRTEHAITNKSVIKYKGSDTELEFTLENTKVLFSKGIKSGAKIFNFLLEKLNDQGYSEVTTYSLQELVDNGIYASTRSAYNNLPKILDKMYEISIEGSTTIYQGRKRDPKKFKKTRLIYELSTTNFGINTLSFTPIIREGLKYITILPSWSYYLNDNAFMLLDYIYIIARQQLRTIKTTGSFQVSIEAVRAHLGLMTIKEAGRDPGKLIRNVIEQAIDEIEQMRDKQDAKRDFEESKKSLSSLQITPIFDFGNDTTETFLQGHLKIELDEYGINYMVNRAVDLEKELSKKAKIEEKAEQKALEKKFKSAQE